jgi:hypothetical protein
MQPGAGLGYEPYGYYEQRGLSYYSPEWRSGLRGQAEEDTRDMSAEARMDERATGYYEYEGSTMDQPNYYTSDWNRRGEFETWWNR